MERHLRERTVATEVATTAGPVHPAVQDNSPNGLIASCQGLVRALAVKTHGRFAGRLDLDDLVGYGQVGLAEAARDFDPARGVQFPTFAYRRVRGAILDGLGKLKWGGRDRRWMRFEKLAADVLDGADDPLVANDLSGRARWLRDVAGAVAVVWFATDGGDEGSGNTLQEVPDTSAPNPEVAAIQREINVIVRLLVDALPADAATLIRGIYFDGVTLQEAADRLKISKGWASRLHARTLAALADALRNMGLGQAS